MCVCVCLLVAQEVKKIVGKRWKEIYTVGTEWTDLHKERGKFTARDVDPLETQYWASASVKYGPSPATRCSLTSDASATPLIPLSALISPKVSSISLGVGNSKTLSFQQLNFAPQPTVLSQKNSLYSGHEWQSLARLLALLLMTTEIP